MPLPHPAAERAPERASIPRAAARWLFPVTWALSLGIALLYLDRGWFPHDLGSVAQPALRTLAGELPHRDFVDVYTGGLAFLGALAFRVLGPTAMAIRWTLFVFFAAWVPAVWYLLRRVATPVVSALATLLAAAWTLPMYAEGMPSWYNLFFATFGVAALFRYLEVRTTRWLALAGMAAGASVVFKVVGLYDVAAGLLALAYLEAAEAPPLEAGSRARDTVYRGLLIGAATVLTASVIVLVTGAMGPAHLFRFATAAVVPCVVLVVRGARATGANSGQRLARAAGLMLPFLAGAVVVGLLFLAPYLASGAVGDVIEGVFVRPRARLGEAAWTGVRGGWLGVILSAATVLAVAAAPRLGSAVRTAAAATLAGALAVVLALSGRVGVYLAAWQALWWLPPWVAIAAGWTVLRSEKHARRGRKVPAGVVPLFLLAATYGFVSLVEVPFAAPIYYFFAAPLMVVLAVSLVAVGVRDAALLRRQWLLGFLLFLLGFTVLRLDRGFIRYLGFRPGVDPQTEPLTLPRAAGLRVSADDRDLYETVVPLVESLAHGPYMYATPDAPELYFLTGLRNPTRTLFEFLDPDSARSADRILQRLDRTGVRVVVINRRPLFSEPVGADLVAGLQARYPLAREVGRFLVVWKQSTATDTSTPDHP